VPPVSVRDRWPHPRWPKRVPENRSPLQARHVQRRRLRIGFLSGSAAAPEIVDGSREAPGLVADPAGELVHHKNALFRFDRLCQQAQPLDRRPNFTIGIGHKSAIGIGAIIHVRVSRSGDRSVKAPSRMKLED